MDKKPMLCRVFKWTINCEVTTPQQFYEFDEEFRDIVCPYLIKYVGVDDMNDYDLIATVVEFNPDGNAYFKLAIPKDKYDQSDFDDIEDRIENALSDFAAWEFGEEEEEEYYYQA